MQAAPGTGTSLAADVAPCTTCGGSGNSADAKSGNVAANGVQNNAALANQQTSVVAAASGNAQTTAANSNDSTIADKGTAAGQSGIASAETGAPGAPSGGQASAQSGAASATGLTAQNAVLNGSQAVVQVGGTNSGAISIQNANTVVVQDQGAAAANSGTANSSIAPASAAGGPTTGGGAAPASIAAPVADASPGRPAVATIGSVGSTTLYASQSQSVVAPVSTPTAISIAQAQSLTLTSGGEAAATSSAACAGTDCSPQKGTTNPPPSAAPVPALPAAGTSSGANAQSGAADAHGAIVRNLVNTDANVQVRIGGDNHGLIQVIINSLTSIFNQGSAQATSGGAAAANGPSAPASPLAGGANASSGSAQTIGSVVNNTVGLQSSASVHVDGDNRNPITIVLDLTARLFNFGQAKAASGDTRATGQVAGATAQSGSAFAAGLVAQNQVALGAAANVDITGNNYADITIELDFDTAIQNVGKAVAISGQSQASSAAPPSPSTQSSSALAQAGSVKANAASTDPPAPSAGAPASPDASTSGAAQMPVTFPLHVDVQSGNARAVGVDDRVVAFNSQTSVASGPKDTAGTASDSATYTIAACGKAVVASGSTYVNSRADAAPAASLIAPDTLCPTPTPTVTPSSGDKGGNQTNGSGATQQEPSGAVPSGQSGPFGPMVQNGSQQATLALPGVQPASGMKRNISLFGIWPAPDQPATPNQQVHLLPPPRPAAPTAAPVEPPGPRTNGQTRADRPTVPTTISQIAREALQTGVAGGNTAISPFSIWPGADVPMMPDPHLRPTVPPLGPIAVVAAPPVGPALSAVAPRIRIPLSSVLLLVAVLTGAMALIARLLWQRPAIRAGLTAAYRFATLQLGAILVTIHRGRRWIARAATLFFVLVLALIEWRR